MEITSTNKGNNKTGENNRQAKATESKQCKQTWRQKRQANETNKQWRQKKQAKETK